MTIKEFFKKVADFFKSVWVFMLDAWAFIKRWWIVMLLFVVMFLMMMDLGAALIACESHTFVGICAIFGAVIGIILCIALAIEEINDIKRNRRYVK